ncbi:hypothetical protein GCM10027610_023540 [Dactylosporangium cerinum]
MLDGGGGGQQVADVARLVGPEDHGVRGGLRVVGVVHDQIAATGAVTDHAEALPAGGDERVADTNARQRDAFDNYGLRSIGIKPARGDARQG